MGLKKVFFLFFMGMMFAFAKAQTVMTPQQYYTFINTALEKVQEEQWDYYKNVVYKSPKKASKSRAKWVKVIEQEMNAILRAGTNGNGALQEAAYTYLVVLRSYQVDQYDYVMPYDFPAAVQGYNLSSYLENSKKATTQLQETFKELIMVKDHFKLTHHINHKSFYQNDTQAKIDRAQQGFNTMQKIYLDFNNTRLNQLKFIESLTTANVNASMQLCDALKNDSSKSNLERLVKNLDTALDRNFIMDFTKTYDHLLVLGTNTAPEAVSYLMTIADAELMNDATNITTTTTNDNPELLYKKHTPLFNTIIDSNDFISTQAKNLAKHQKNYLKRFVTSK